MLTRTINMRGLTVALTVATHVLALVTLGVGLSTLAAMAWDALFQ